MSTSDLGEKILAEANPVAIRFMTGWLRALGLRIIFEPDAPPPARRIEARSRFLPKSVARGNYFEKYRMPCRPLK